MFFGPKIFTSPILLKLCRMINKYKETIYAKFQLNQTKYFQKNFGFSHGSGTHNFQKNANIKNP